MNNKKFPLYRTGIGQDSHRFLSPEVHKPCTLGGLIIDDAPGFQANSDGDIIFHAICNAISSLSGIPILGKKADEMYKKEGITDSKCYLEEALKTLKMQKIVHVALSIEGLRPKLLKYFPALKKNIASVLHIQPEQIGITATTGEGLTDFGCGIGMQCICILTTYEE